MLCKELISKLNEYLDGELEPALAAQLEHHLKHCEDCTILVDTTRKTIDIYCQTAPAPLPEDVMARLRQAFAAKFG